MALRPPTPAQARQRQLSWLLRISTGSAENLGHALGLATSLMNEEWREVNIVRKELLALERKIRRMLK